jgi:hypothetical protein
MDDPALGEIEVLQGEGKLVANERIIAPPAQIRRDRGSAIRVTVASLGVDRYCTRAMP